MVLVSDPLCFASIGLHAGLRRVTQPVALPLFTRRYPTTVATLSRRARDIIEQSFEHTRWIRGLRAFVVGQAQAANASCIGEATG